METIEVRYFLQMAKEGSVRKAAESIGISPSAISKAIARLEEELEVKLVEKVGRNIALTPAGKQLERQGTEFLAIERQIVESHRPNKSDIKIKIVGPELPLSHWGVALSAHTFDAFPEAQIEFEVTSNQVALEMVDSYQADLALFATQKTFRRDKGLTKKLDEVSLKTFASSKHPISKRKSVSIADIVHERFAVTNSDALSLFEGSKSSDGWQDDKFNRSHLFFTDSLRTLESVLAEGLSISYLPDFYGKKLGLKEIQITNCPYKCHFTVYLCRNKYGLNELWKLL